MTGSRPASMIVVLTLCASLEGTGVVLMAGGKPEAVVGSLGALDRWHTAGMLSQLKLSPDGRFLTTSPAAQGIVVFDATGKRVLHIPGMVGAGEISHDGKRLFLIEAKPTVLSPFHSILKVYQLSDGKLLKTIEGTKNVASFALGTDDRTLALELTSVEVDVPKKTVNVTSHLELRDLTTDRVLRTFGEQKQAHFSNWLLFAPDSTSLYAISVLMERKGEKSKVRRFDCATGDLKSQMMMDGVHWADERVWNGKNLVAVGDTIWDLEKERQHWKAKGNVGVIKAFMPDGATVLGDLGATIGGPTPIVQWDLEANREIKRFEGRGGSRYAVSVDGRVCFGGTSFSRVVVWSLKDGKTIADDVAPIDLARRIVFSLDGKHVVTLGLKGLYVWHVLSRNLLRETPLEEDQLRTIGPLCFTPDGKQILFPCRGTIHVFDIGSGERTQCKLDGFKHTQCELSPDGKTLAGFEVAGADALSTITLWDWDSGKVIGDLSGFERHVSYVEGEMRRIMVEMALPTRRPFFLFRGLRRTRIGTVEMVVRDPPTKVVDQQCGPVAFSHDGKLLACRIAHMGYPGETDRVQVWNVADRKLVFDKETGQQASRRLLALRFVEGGELGGLLAGYDSSAGVCLWNSKSGLEQRRFLPPDVARNPLTPSISPDGKLVVVGTEGQKLVRFWEVATGKEAGHFEAPLGVCNWTFSPDGKIFAVSLSDGTVLLLDMQRVVKKS